MRHTTLGHLFAATVLLINELAPREYAVPSAYALSVCTFLAYGPLVYALSAYTFLACAPGSNRTVEGRAAFEGL